MKDFVRSNPSNTGARRPSVHFSPVQSAYNVCANDNYAKNDLKRPPVIASAKRGNFERRITVRACKQPPNNRAPSPQPNSQVQQPSQPNKHDTNNTKHNTREGAARLRARVS
jgi:hypothetical protein